MKLSTLLLPILLTPFAASHQHIPLARNLHHQQLAPARRDQLTERDLVNFLRALSIAKRQKAGNDDDDDEGLLGGLLGGSSSTRGTSSATSTGRGGKTTAHPSDTDSNSDEEKPGSSTISGPTSRSSSTLPTSSAVNSTSASAISSTSSSPSPSSSAMTSLITDAEGSVKVVTQIITSTPSAAPSASADANADNKSNGKKDDSPISTPAIIGISVGAGVVVLTLIACAVWRMKRRRGDEDEAIRWPELNRHGDADTHHALPARVTGQHGIETNALERSLSNSSSVFAPSSAAPPMSAPPMALNGSGFGAASSLEDYDYHEKSEAPPVPGSQHAHSSPPMYYGSPVTDHDDDYANLPPAVGVAQGAPSMLAYDSESEGHGQQMSMAQGHQGVTRYQGR